jgi:hypothetical protein
MRKSFGQSLRIGVSRHAVVLVKASRFGKVRPEVLAELALGGAGMPGFDAIGAALRQLLTDAACAGWSATVVLADDLARIWQVTPPAGAARLADLEGAAALRFQSLYGEPAANWKLAGGWDANKAFIACALPRALLDMLAAVAAEQQVTLVEIAPQFVAGWNRWHRELKPGAWFGLVHNGVLTLGAIDAGQVCAVRASAVPEGASVDWLGQHVAREALRLNLAVPQRLQLSGRGNPAWNNSSGAFACAWLSPQIDTARSPAAQLAVTGLTS